MAAMMASAAMPMSIYAVPDSSTSSSSSDTDLQTALTTVKKRIKIPDELTEFEYSTSESYKTKAYNFTWHKKDENSPSLDVSIFGNIITYYYYYDSSNSYYGNASIAKLSNDQIIAKAKEYVYQLDPSFKDKVKFEIGSLSINSDKVNVFVTRHEDNIPVSSNDCMVTINKNTGELISFVNDTDWWENASFDSPKNAMSEKEIEEAYKSLCKLTPYYKITTNWETNEKTARIVYQPDFNSEIDAFTGKKSTIWEDMQNAEGTQYVDGGYHDTAAGAVNDTAEEALEMEDAGGVSFTEAELKKIEIDKSLITPEKAFEQLKKDKFAALTDDYEIKSYNVYSDETNDKLVPLTTAENSDSKEKEKDPNYYMSINFSVKSNLKDTYKGYKNINVQINAKTGKVIYISKYSKSGDLPKLNVSKAKSIADSAAKTYAKDIISGYKSDKSNSDPVETWGQNNEYYETARTFIYNRYVNGIQVYGDWIHITVDSEGTVTNYSFNHTEDVKFPSADILSTDEAFAKLYEQQDFDFYYDGWRGKDGKVRTYLLYKMDSFYLNAKTGKLCNWRGEDITESVDTRKIKYTDIKGIPQEKAILELQRHGAMLSEDKKFRPNDNIEYKEFETLIYSALLNSVGVYDDDVLAVEEAEVPEEDPSGNGSKTNTSKYITREQAAVIFAKASGFGNYAELKGIYKTPFSDVKSSNENIGAIAIAYSKGFLKGENGKFGGEKNITRAEAAQIIYDYIINNQNTAK